MNKKSILVSMALLFTIGCQSAISQLTTNEIKEAIKSGQNLDTTDEKIEHKGTVKTMKEYYENYKKELKEALGKEHKVPKLLKKVIEFNIYAGEREYLERFGLDIIEDVVWDFFEANDVEEDDLEILEKKLIPFAINEHCSYAFWLEEGKPTEELLIVRISSDGYVLLEAANLKDFVRLTTAGGMLFTFDDNELQEYIDKPLLKEYRQWVNDELNLEPIKSEEDIQQIYNKAEEQYYDAFSTWIKKHGYENPIEKLSN